jgi:hypothetical protein
MSDSALAEHRRRQAAYMKEYRKRNPEVCKAAVRAAYYKNKSKALNRSRKWAEKNRAKVRAISRRSGAKQRESCCDAYIKYLISDGTGLSHADIPQELVSVKRNHVLLLRALRSSEHG